jgi:hypothetical protein
MNKLPSQGVIKLTTPPKLPLINAASGYQARDAEIIDYNLWKLWTPRSGFTLRGPRPAKLNPGDYCVSLGAAFTFGRFVPHPYPELLGKALNLDCLNLGFSGIGPSFFNHPPHRGLISLINRSKFVTILVLSGRSQANSRFKTCLHSQERYVLEDGQSVPADYAYQQLLETESTETVRALVAETRERYLQEFSKLLNKITVPKVLLWISKRPPDYQESYDSLLELFSSFPHLVNQDMINSLKVQCEAYIEYCEIPGLPQRLTNRFNGQPTAIKRSRDYPEGKIQLTDSWLTHNHYYPSPEMHEAVAQKLARVCQQFV